MDSLLATPIFFDTVRLMRLSKERQFMCEKGTVSNEHNRNGTQVGYTSSLL